MVVLDADELRGQLQLVEGRLDTAKYLDQDTGELRQQYDALLEQAHVIERSDPSAIITPERAKEVFGVDPRDIGIRHRGWWIEEYDGKPVLVVTARDGMGNFRDVEAKRKPNFLCLEYDEGDPTHVYYYFEPLKKEESSE